MPQPLVFVFGDTIVDSFVVGAVDRICPEAPVPILVRAQTSAQRGGAWNTAMNVEAAGARCVFGTVVGPVDVEAEKMALDLGLSPTDPHGGMTVVLSNPRRSIHRKTRFIGQYGQMILRVDPPKDGPISGPLAYSLVSMTGGSAERTFNPNPHEQEFTIAPNAILVSDYACGVVTRDLIEAIFKTYPGVPVVVDPHPSTDVSVYAGVSYILPNESEYNRVRESGTSFHAVAGRVIMKRGARPTRLYDSATTRGEIPEFVSIPVPHRNLVDPCSAGDAFAAYFTAALAHDVSLKNAVAIANNAGSVAVSERGTVVVRHEQVRDSLRESRSDVVLWPPVLTRID